jgi:hypothetical protein
VVVLATFHRPIADPGMLTVSLAASFCPLDTVRALLEAGETGPREKREKDQDDDTCCPQAVLCTLFHHEALSTFLSSLSVPVNPGCPFIISEGTAFVG